MGPSVHWYSDKSNGHACFIGFNLIQKVGVVVLSNTKYSVDDLGFFALAPNVFPIKPYAKLPQLTATTLKRYEGKYELTPEVQIEVTRRGGRLYAQLTNEPRYRIYPVSPNRFGYAQGKRVISFVNKKGKPAHQLNLTEGLTKYGALRVK